MTKNIDLISKKIFEYAIQNECDVFGQNLFKPSYISGLGKFLVKKDGITPLKPNWFDATNSELTSVGFGIGRSLANKNTLLIVKQQDFLYLANDQFINTTINCIGNDSLKGKFRIICLISDLPKEGTQAYSNNISLFSNLSKSIKIDYCFSPDSFQESLNENESGLTISFLSNEYVYKSKFFNEIKFKACNNDLYYYGDGDVWDIIIGFIPEIHLKKIYNKKKKIFYPTNLTKMRWLKVIEKSIENENPNTITLHESSSSNFIFSDHIYTFLKRKFPEISILINNYRENQKGSFSLKKQRNFL